MMQSGSPDNNFSRFGAILARSADFFDVVSIIARIYNFVRIT
jgi:hypothetical protein